MCEKCIEIDEIIARYRRLQKGVPDKQAYEAADTLVAALEARKAELHAVSDVE
jgi:hypothetical protein